MVRLNLGLTEQQVMNFIVFQFQNGTIKFGEKCIVLKYEREFQFQNGTIKLLKYVSTFFLFFQLFQFQNGTIKFANIKFIIIVIIVFQFQNGTIKFVIYLISNIFS